MNFAEHVYRGQSESLLGMYTEANLIAGHVYRGQSEFLLGLYAEASLNLCWACIQRPI